MMNDTLKIANVTEIIAKLEESAVRHDIWSSRGGECANIYMSKSFREHEIAASLRRALGLDPLANKEVVKLRRRIKREERENSD